MHCAKAARKPADRGSLRTGPVSGISVQGEEGKQAWKWEVGAGGEGKKGLACEKPTRTPVCTGFNSWPGHGFEADGRGRFGQFQGPRLGSGALRRSSRHLRQLVAWLKLRRLRAPKGRF